MFGPVSPSPTRLWSCAAPSGSAVLPSHSANSETSSPTRHSSITTEAPASPNAPRLHHRVDRRQGLAPRSPPPRRPCRRPGRRPSPRSARRDGGRIRAPPRHRRSAPTGPSGMPAASQSSLVNVLLPSSCAAARDGTDAGDAGGLHRIGDAGDQRRLRAGHHQVDLVVLREGDERGDIQHADRARIPRPGRCRDCQARTTASSAAGWRRSPSRARARVRPIRSPERAWRAPAGFVHGAVAYAVPVGDPSHFFSARLCVHLAKFRGHLIALPPPDRHQSHRAASARRESCT